MIKENTYFEGSVKSLGFTHADSDVTVGVMVPGSYTFSTGNPECMTVVKGALTIKRVGDKDWMTFESGDAFEVAGNSSFEVKVEASTAYLCEYL